MSRMQHALARCYFHSPMPSLLRPLRDQYRLAVSREGKWPRFSLARRNESSARILYYHRVNDGQDPFFPAISTGLFEQEMRFLSRHYKVVSLARLLEFLPGGNTEPVVAITFDDGYRDNCENALPILQRYGLPATIFLTTGSMDTGEPLWFDRLALALKKTDRKFVDFQEKRLVLGTIAERLRANKLIFSALRLVPDRQRQQLLAEVLRLLGAPDEGEQRWKMLSWDQARRMLTDGIRFGGHTVSHPFLSRLPAEEFRWEVSECKRRIENELQLAVEHFSYPNGRPEDFGFANKALVREAGYRAAVTTIWGVNSKSTDPFELRRGGPWEQSPAAFAYKLDWYQLTNG